MNRILKGLFAVAALAALLAASSCGSSSSSPVMPVHVDAGLHITLDNVCDVLPGRYCAQDRPCCSKAGYTFDEANCEASYRQGCLAGVAAVNARTATFDPANIDACIAEYQPFEDKCSLTAADFASLPMKSSACARVFLGTRAVGDSCNSTSDCAPSDSGTIICLSGVCQSFSAGLAAGADCTSNACAPGLVCDETSLCSPDPAPEYAVNPAGCGGHADGGSNPEDGGSSVAP